MKITTYEGIVQNGCVQLPAEVVLPEKAKVYVVVPEVPEMEIERVAHVYSPRLANPADAIHFKMEVREEGTNAGL